MIWALHGGTGAEQCLPGVWKDHPPEDLPWAFAERLLTEDINALPRVFTTSDLPGTTTVAEHAAALAAVMAQLREDPLHRAANAAFALYPRWVLRRDPRRRSGASNHTSRSNPLGCIRQRARAFRNGDWEQLHAAFLDSVGAFKPPARDALLRRHERSAVAVGANNCKKGMQALLECDQALTDGPLAVATLSPLHPTGGRLTPEQRAELTEWLASAAPQKLEFEDMEWALRTSPRAAAPGPLGWRVQHWKRLCNDYAGPNGGAHPLNCLTDWANGALASGHLDDELRNLWGSCVTIALCKRAGGHRPVSMGNVERRLTGRASLKKIRAAAEVRFRGEGDSSCLQLGCMTKNGSEHALHDINLHLQLHPTAVVVHVDVTNAFNSQSRYHFLREVKTHFPELLHLAAQFYMEDTNLLVWGKAGQDGTQPLHCLVSASGQQQGDTLGSFLFCLGIHPVLEAVHKAYPSVLVRAICDDVHLAGPPDDVAAAFTLLHDGLRAQGLELKYGPKKTCCWSPTFARGAGEDDSVAAARRAACPISADVVRLGEGMATLGSFIGTDAFVSESALMLVIDTSLDATSGAPNNPTSIANACRAVEEMAGGKARNARDMAGHLLRVCVVPKVTYLARTIEPRLFAAGARRADDLLAAAFCAIYTIDTSIFAPDATPFDKFVAARIRSPARLKGCALRSAAATSEAAYLASWRAVAPFVKGASSMAARAAIADMSQPFAANVPILATLRELASRLGDQLSAVEVGVKDCLAPKAFASSKAPNKLQHSLAYAAELAAYDTRLTEASLSVDDTAHLNSSDSRWLTHARMSWLQLTDEEVVIRMQRYLRQPLSVLKGLVGATAIGKIACTGAPIIIDAFGDCFLSQYNAKGDGEWNQLHNNVRDRLADCGRNCGVHTETEKGRSAFIDGKRRPADVLCAGHHGYTPAAGKELWVDASVGSALCPTYVAAAAAAPGGAAQMIADRKHIAARGAIPGHAYFLAAAFEADGFISPCTSALLFGFAKVRADRDHADDCARRAWHQHAMDSLAHTLARSLARCIANRASATWLHKGGARKRRRLLAGSDVEASLPFVVPLSGEAGASKRQRRDSA